MHAQRKNIWWIKLAFPALDNIKETLKEELKSCEAFSLALDESTDISDTAQLVIFIRAVTAAFDIVEGF